MSVPNLIVDMHTHVFNANYIPLEEVFISKKIPKKYARKLAKLVSFLAKSSKLRFRLPAVAEEEDISFESILKANYKSFAGLDPNEARINSLRSTIIDMVLIELYLDMEGINDGFDKASAVEESELYALLVELDREFGDAESTALDLYSKQGLILDSIDRLDFAGVVTKSAFPGLRKKLDRFLKTICKFVEAAGDFFDFVITMMRGERKILNLLEDYYADLETNFLLVHHMMDMDYPFDGEADFDFYKRQLPKMTALEKHSKGSLIGFSAFDPIRCVDQKYSDEDIRALIDISLSYGKVGFKFYPGLGYRAADNENEPKLEHVVDVFFDYCVEKEIPVFTHCTPTGFEQSPGNTGANSHPKYWEKCLTKPGREKLRLCFGHAGGGLRKIDCKVVHGWLCDSNDQNKWDDVDNYARWVVRLCRQYKNVYCETAYMHEIIGNSGNSKKFKERLKIEYGRAVDEEHPHAFSDKIMYGSDWHMPSMINDIDDYIQEVLQIFSDGELTVHKESFFSQNAIRFLDLYGHLDRVSHIFGEEYIESVRNKIPKL